MTNQATGTGVLAGPVKVMVNEPVPGTAAATAAEVCTCCSVASTRLDGVTPDRLTVTDFWPACTVAVPELEKVTLPDTASAVPAVEFAATPVP